MITDSSLLRMIAVSEIVRVCQMSNYLLDINWPHTDLQNPIIRKAWWCTHGRSHCHALWTNWISLNLTLEQGAKKLLTYETWYSLVVTNLWWWWWWWWPIYGDADDGADQSMMMVMMVVTNLWWWWWWWWPIYGQPDRSWTRPMDMGLATLSWLTCWPFPAVFVLCPTGFSGD